MKVLFAFLFLLLALSFPAASIAPSSVPDLVLYAMSLFSSPFFCAACFGHRYESDQDMNEGNTISDEEILRILNPPRS